MKKNIISKIFKPILGFPKSIIKFIVDTAKEVKSMKWQTFKEWLGTTLFVLSSSLIIILIILVLDVIFYQLRDKYLLT